MVALVLVCVCVDVCMVALMYTYTLTAHDYIKDSIKLLIRSFAKSYRRFWVLLNHFTFWRCYLWLGGWKINCIFSASARLHSSRLYRFSSEQALSTWALSSIWVPHAGTFGRNSSQKGWEPIPGGSTTVSCTWNTTRHRIGRLCNQSMHVKSMPSSLTCS